MPAEPPRRRRTEPPSSRRSSSAPSLLPTIALGIGVVVAGLGIGAFLSAMQNRGASHATTATAPSGLPVVTPVAQPTRGPIAIATLVAHATDTPSPKPAATHPPTASPKPAVTARAAATARAAPATPAATTKPTASPAAKPTLAPTPRPTATHPAPTPPPATPRPTIPPTPAPTPAARVAPAGPPSFAAQAQTTVRRYLDALIAGNENAAYAALGAAPGDPNARLSEEAFIDRGTRITSIRTTAVNANGATVEVEISSSRGAYYATYHVTAGAGGPVIDQHDYIKV
jgi:hypothetical protein